MAKLATISAPVPPPPPPPPPVIPPPPPVPDDWNREYRDPVDGEVLIDFPELDSGTLVYNPVSQFMEWKAAPVAGADPEPPMRLMPGHVRIKQVSRHSGVYGVPDMKLVLVRVKQGVMARYTLPLTSKELSDMATFKTAIKGAGLENSAAKKLLEIFDKVITKLDMAGRIAMMHKQFGWHNDGAALKFVSGEEEFAPKSVLATALGGEAAQRSKYFTTAGTVEGWRNLHKSLYGGPGLEIHALATLSAFGAPLADMAFDEGSGILALIGGSGGGKSMVRNVCASVYGDYREIGSWSGGNNTLNSMFANVQVMRNLPSWNDDVQGLSADAVKNLVYTIANGAPRTRLNTTGKVIDPGETWCNIHMFTSNQSMMSALTTGNDVDVAVANRLLEITIPTMGFTATSAGDVEARLTKNHGVVGRIYLQGVVNNYGKIKSIVNSLVTKFNATGADRFAVRTAACMIAGGVVAQKMGLIDVDMDTLEAAMDRILRVNEGSKKEVASIAKSFMDEFIHTHSARMATIHRIPGGAPVINAPVIQIEGTFGYIDVTERRLYVMRDAVRRAARKAGVDHKTAHTLLSDGNYKLLPSPELTRIGALGPKRVHIYEILQTDAPPPPPLPVNFNQPAK